MDFAAKYGEVQTPRHDEAWSMISSGVGAAEQHRQCTQGKHDFDFCPDIMEHTCFFCLYIDGQSSDNDDPEVPQPMAAKEKGSKRKSQSSSDDDGDEKTPSRLRSSDFQFKTAGEASQVKVSAEDEGGGKWLKSVWKLGMKRSKSNCRTKK